MEELRLKWEPHNQASMELVELCVKTYVAGRDDGITIMSNGALLFTKNGRNNLFDARKVLEEAKLFFDFYVTKMKDSAYLVTFHDVVAVFVGVDEFNLRKHEILKRLDELKFPGEVFFQDNKSEPEENILIGLYARGKLQYDAHHFSIYKRIESS